MNPRDYAVLALDDKRLPGMPRQAFKRRSPVVPADPRDRALAEQITLGCVKNWLHLTWLITRFASRPIDQVDNRARLILAVALYQHRFLDRVPEHAIVTEAVAQTRRLGEPTLPRAAGFVNAILRQAIREPDLSASLPARSEDPAGYAQLVLSHPRPLFERLAALLGPEDALRFCEHDNRTPPTLLRLARGHTIDDLQRDLDGAPGEPGAPDGDPAGTLAAPEPADGRDGAGGDASVVDERTATVELLPHEAPGIVVVRGAKQADFARWSEKGLAQVQDATSAGIVTRLDVNPGMTVLDRCSGVGTKTQQLAEAVGADGRVFAVDAAGARISTLRRLVSRRKDLSHITAKRGEWMKELPAEWPDAYDRILIDAPCSNSGVLARRAEARYIDLAEADAALPPLQLAILRDTWPFLAPGGLLAYATCSVFPLENGQVVRAFMAAHPEAELVEEHAVLPSYASDDPTVYRDGGYVAVLRKPG